MAGNTQINGETNDGRGGLPWRVIGWSIPALLLLLPLVAMQFTTEVNWDGPDFIFAGVLFGSVGVAFELIVRKSRSLSYRSGAALAVITAFLTVWVNAAVGMIGSEDNPLNLLFGGVLLVALTGAILARFDPAGMMRAMVVTAIAQTVAGAVGLSSDERGAVLSMGFAGLWLLAAALFRNAAHSKSTLQPDEPAQ